jgi:hypothetical protein
VGTDNEEEIIMDSYQNTTVRDASGAIVGYEPVTNDTPYNALGMIRTTNTIGQTVTKPVQTPLEKIASVGYGDNQNQPVQINPNKNTSNIDAQYNQPGSAMGKQWAFGNPEKEGVYKPVANVNAELQGIKHDGTLYKSDAGRWQIIDKRGMLVMSGSPGAELPKITEYDAKPWLNVNNQPYGKTSGMESPKVIAGGTGAPSVSGGSGSGVSGNTTPPGENANLQFAEIETTKPYAWGALSPSATAEPTTAQKRKIAESYGTGGYGLAADNYTITYYGEPTKLKIVNGTVKGDFGAKQKRKPQSKPAQKPIGFMDIFGSAKNTTIKRGSGLSYENLLVSARKPSKPIKSPVKKPLQSPVKKPTTKKKDIGFGNAYEVLFSNKRRK